MRLIGRKSEPVAERPVVVPPQRQENSTDRVHERKSRSARQATGVEQPRLSRRERRKIATREALLNAAQEVIARKGVHLAVIEDITERADVAKGSFYQYFRDRDDLLYELLTRRLTELRQCVVSLPSTERFADRVRILIHHHLDYLIAHEDFLLFLHQIRGLIKMRGDATPNLREAYRDYLVFLQEWLAPDARKGARGEKAREEGVCLLLGTLTGFLSHYTIFESLDSLVSESARLESSFTDVCLDFLQ